MRKRTILLASAALALSAACYASPAAPWMPEFELSGRRAPVDDGLVGRRAGVRDTGSAIMPDVEDALVGRTSKTIDGRVGRKPSTEGKLSSHMPTVLDRRDPLADLEEELVGRRPNVQEARSGRRSPLYDSPAAQFPTPGEER